MTPELKFITPVYITAQQTRFARAAERFGRIYADGQNQFTSLGKDVLARLAGRPTPSGQIGEAVVNLTETRLNLAEVRAREAAQVQPTNPLYRQALAEHFAQEYLATGQEVLTTTQRENSNLGVIDDFHRANTTHDGAGFRFFGGFAMVAFTAALGQFNLIDGPSGATALTDLGIFITATGAIDTARHMFLGSFNRSRINLHLASVTSLIRKRASVQEGQITGDEVEGSLPMDQRLEARLATETLDQLEMDNITKPDFLNPDLTDILAQRASLRSRLPGYEDLNELVNSRNVARVSRLTRTLLFSAIAAGLLMVSSIHTPAPAVHTELPNSTYCGSRTFPQPDHYMRTIAGTDGVSSLRGIAQNEWFKSVFGWDFKPNDPIDQAMFDKAFQADPRTNEVIVRRIAELIRSKNLHATIIGDYIPHGQVINEVCPDELKNIYATTLSR